MKQTLVGKLASKTCLFVLKRLQSPTLLYALLLSHTRQHELRHSQNHVCMHVEYSCTVVPCHFCELFGMTTASQIYVTTISSVHRGVQFANHYCCRHTRARRPKKHTLEWRQQQRNIPYLCDDDGDRTIVEMRKNKSNVGPFGALLFALGDFPAMYVECEYARASARGQGALPTDGAQKTRTDHNAASPTDTCTHWSCQLGVYPPKILKLYRCWRCTQQICGQI